jgi:hypothetical protein
MNGKLHYGIQVGQPYRGLRARNVVRKYPSSAEHSVIIKKIMSKK